MTIDSGHQAFMLLSSALVLFMTPGVAFFYGGMVSEGNVVTIMMQSFVTMGVISIWWWLIGFSLCFGQSGQVIGNPGTYVALTNIGPVDPIILGNPGGAIASIPMYAVEGISAYVFCMFQLTFAIETPTMITGSFVERMRFKPFVIFLVLWATFVYAPFAHLTWGGGLFAQWGVYDFAGGTVVHMTAGWSALGSILVLGKRNKEAAMEEKPHSVPIVLLGTAILWFTWFGFCGGSALVASGPASAAYINTQLSAASSLWFWLLIDWLYRGKPSLVGACVGAVCGLVGITPNAGYVQPWAAIVIGIIVAVICQLVCEIRKKFLGRWLDDALDIWATHGVGGTVGAILVGVLSDPPECAPGMDAMGNMLQAPSWCASPNTAYRSPKNFGKQILAALICAVWSTCITFIILKALSLVMELRPQHQEEGKSVDEHEHGELAYHTPTKVFSEGKSVDEHEQGELAFSQA